VNWVPGSRVRYVSRGVEVVRQLATLPVGSLGQARPWASWPSGWGGSGRWTMDWSP